MDDDTELAELEEPCECGDIAEETAAVEVAEDAPDDKPAQPKLRPRRKRRCHCMR